MLTLRFGCAVCLVCAGSAAQAAAQGYPEQYAQQQPQYQQPQYQQQYPQQQYQQYPQQQPAQGADQQQPPPGYFPTPDAQGSYGYQQQYAPNAVYPQQQQQGYGAPEAPAEPLVSSVKGAFQLSAGISLLQYQTVSMSQTGMTPAAVVDPAAPPGTPPPAAAVVPPALYGRTMSHPIHLEAGYGVTDNILVGALFQLASYSEPREVSGAKFPMSDFAFTVAPKFDYQFSPTSRLNPFIGALASISLQSKKYYGNSDSLTLFGVAARAGLRYFVLDQLSIDPLLTLGFNFGSGKQKQVNATTIELENSVSGIQFALAMGVSLYIK
jgi:hypothetical protein